MHFFLSLDLTSELESVFYIVPSRHETQNQHEQYNTF